MQQKIYISSSYIIKRQQKMGNIVFSIDYKGILGSKALNDPVATIEEAIMACLKLVGITMAPLP
jgi:hypothetical protein